MSSNNQKSLKPRATTQALNSGDSKLQFAHSGGPNAAEIARRNKLLNVQELIPQTPPHRRPREMPKYPVAV